MKGLIEFPYRILCGNIFCFVCNYTPVDSEHQERYKCYHKACLWLQEKENIDWGYFGDWGKRNGDCSNCLAMCDKNVSCGAVECGDGYCSWWQNYTCNDENQFFMDTNGSFHTCVKIFDDDIYSRLLQKIK